MKTHTTRTQTHRYMLWPKAGTLLTAVPELAGLTVHSRQQQPGSLPDIIAVHREAASVFGVNHSHAHPLHQRWQHHERPMGGDKGTCSWPPETHMSCSALARKIHLIQNLHILFWRSCPAERIFENRMNSCPDDGIKDRQTL